VGYAIVGGLLVSRLLTLFTTQLSTSNWRRFAISGADFNPVGLPSANSPPIVRNMPAVEPVFSCFACPRPKLAAGLDASDAYSASL
jgi:hypothetical protein